MLRKETEKGKGTMEIGRVAKSHFECGWMETQSMSNVTQQTSRV